MTLKRLVTTELGQLTTREQLLWSVVVNGFSYNSASQKLFSGLQLS